MYNGICVFSTVDGKNTLATTYCQSHLHKKVLEELDHVDKSIAEGAEGQNKPAEYATSFLYQVSQPHHSKSGLL